MYDLFNPHKRHSVYEDKPDHDFSQSHREVVGTERQLEELGSREDSRYRRPWFSLPSSLGKLRCIM